MIRSRNFERRFATAVIASVVVLLSFASAAQAIERISVLPGFNGPVNAISEPDSNGTRYLGGDFTLFQPWDTGGGALTSNTSGAVDPSFPKVNGPIYATAADGSGGFYIGGSFNCIGPNTSGSCGGPDDVDRRNAAHINANGSVDLDWNPNVDNAVRAIALSGSTVYLGGYFTTVDSVPGLDKTRNRAAAVDATTGIATSWNPNLNSAVLAMAVSGSSVYLGGGFTCIGGPDAGGCDDAGEVVRNRAAAVDATTGIATDWDPNLSSAVLAMAVSGSTVYLGGYFRTVGGTTRNYAAAVRTGSRTAPGEGTCLDNYNTADCLTSWNPDLDGSVHAIAVSGSNVYLGGGFTTVDSVPGLDKTRNRAAAVDATTGVATSWNPNLNSAVFAIGVSGSTVYLGGGFTCIGGPDADRNCDGAGEVVRNIAAAVNATTGIATSWNPDLDDYVFAIGVSGSNVYLGGQFSTVGGTARNFAAAVGTDGTLTDWNPGLNGSVRAIGVLESTVYLGGYFSTVGGTTRNYAAAVNAAGNLTAWNPGLNGGVSAIGVSGSNVYLGGDFTTVGVTTRNRAAAVDATTGIATDWNPNLNNAVRAMALSGSTVYLGGYFTTVDSVPGLDKTRNRAAAVNAATGIATSWNPNLNSAVLAIAVSGSNVYLGGEFEIVSGIAHNYAAQVGNTDGSPTDWNPGLYYDGGEEGAGSVNAIALSGNNIYLGGYFTEANESSETRNYAAAVNNTNGDVTGWNPDPSDAVFAIAVSGSTVYLGGYFTRVGPTTRFRSAAVGTNGTLLPPWPGPLATDAVLSVSKSGSGSGTVASSPAGIDCGTTCSTPFASGTSVTLTASPTTGSSFTGWSGSGCSGTSTCTVTMSEARAVNAEFAVVPPGSFNLAVTKSGTGAGTVSSSPAGIDCGSDCSETLADGSSVTLTAAPAAGSSFTGWSGAGCSGKSTCTVVMSEARAVDAKFTKKPSNVFPTPKVKAGGSALSSSVRVPGPGTITQRVTRSSTVAAVLTVCKTSRKATKAGWVKLTCKLSAATRAALRQRSLRVSVKTTFTPTGGLPASKTQVVTLKSQRPPPYTG